jgi:hypothetical protein
MCGSYSQATRRVNPTRKDGAGGDRASFAAMSPGGCCWICGRPLARYPQAVFAALATCDFFCLVCSDRCGATAIADVAWLVAAILLDGASAFARWLEASDRYIIAMSNKAYEHARRGGRLRLRIFPVDGGTDVE